MATSEVSICNTALAFLKVQTIESLDEASNPARLCRTLYPRRRDLTLREYPWGFARRIVALAPVPEEVPGWSHVYSYPADCLYALELTGEGAVRGAEPLRFLVAASPDLRDRRILATIPRARLEYTARVEDPTLYDPAFTEALARGLAADLAFPLTGDGQAAEAHMAQHMRALEGAKGVDAAENKRPVEPSRRYLQAR